MKTLFRLAKKSAKKVFFSLRENAPYFSPALGKNVYITKIFLGHITNISTKNRSYKEIVERILIIPFVQEALKKGVITESRNQESFSFTRLEFSSGSDIFCFILTKEKRGYILISCFRKFVYKKRDLS